MEQQQPVLLFGKMPNWINGSGAGAGYGSGSGYGYGDGYGAGYGSGDGSGSGDGYGDGYGSGSGDGYGDGDGYGSGSGAGYGDGSGDGDGYGAGYGAGSGAGDGYGYGSKEYWCSTIPYFTNKWPEEQQKRFEAAKAAGATIAFWRSDKNGQPANNGKRMTAAAPGVIHTAEGPLVLCRAGTLHATFVPPKWSGERWWIVAMHGDLADNGDDKIGSLKREILGEAL